MAERELLGKEGLLSFKSRVKANPDSVLVASYMKHQIASIEHGLVPKCLRQLLISMLQDHVGSGIDD
jgi:hypothetical protein